MVSYDQHFMKNEEILNLIIDSAQIKSSDEIFEIGPGECHLSEKILDNKPKSLFSVEIDNKFTKTLEVLKKDFLNFSFEIGSGINIIEQISFNKVISNIPYTITEPLYMRLIEINFDLCILMHGKNFYDRILKNDSISSCFVNSHFNVELISEIAGNKFDPPTKVKSVIVKITRKENFDLRDKFFVNLYSKRTRNLKNALVFTLVDTYSVKKKEAKLKVSEIENKMNYNFSQMKIDELDNEEFMYIINLLLNKNL